MKFAEAMRLSLPSIFQKTIASEHPSEQVPTTVTPLRYFIRQQQQHLTSTASEKRLYAN